MRLIAIAALALSAAIVPSNAAIVASKIVGWANVNYDGSLSSYKNLTANYHRGVGEYELVFKTNVSACALTATSSDYPFGVRAVPLGGKAIALDTFQTTTGEHFDSNFYVVVTC